MLDAIRGLAALAATAAIVLVLAGFFGRVHPAFDTLGAFRIHALVAFGGLFVFAMIFRALTARILALAGVVIATAGLAPEILPEDPVGVADLHIYSQNLRFDNPTPGRVTAEIRATQAEVVLLQEVSESNRQVVRDLGFRESLICEFAGIGDVALLSKYPVRGTPGCARGQGVAWARVVTPWGPVTVVTLHLPWPWPHSQAQHAQRISEILSDLEEPLVIAGDFNIPAWGHSLLSIAEATGTRPVRGLRLTFRRPEFWPGLPLDHVLISEDLAGETRMLGQFGSDHAALLTGLRFR